MQFLPPDVNLKLVGIDSPPGSVQTTSIAADEVGALSTNNF
ncbi:MAG: hypothetical protein R2792_02480 [Saprospiraceae bacterium]